MRLHCATELDRISGFAEVRLDVVPYGRYEAARADTNRDR
jgi:hypothetical protein